MRKIFKIIVAALLLFMVVTPQTLAAINSTLGTQQYLKKVETNTIAPTKTTWELGSAAYPWADGYFTDLTVAGVFTLSGIMGSDLDMDGYDIVLDTDGDTKITNDRDVGVGDDEFLIDILGASDFKFASNLFTLLSGSAITIEDGALQMGTATIDTGTLTMIKGAQASDPQVQLALSADANGDFSVTSDTGDITLSSADDIYLSPTGDDTVITGKINADKTEAAAAADGTRYYDYLTTASVSPAAAAEVNSGYFGYNWTAGDNANFIANGAEGVVRAQGPDESMTARGLLGRFYIDAATNPAATLRTGIGVESSARASYNGGPEVAAEAGTAFVGSRIWMAPYFSAATVNNLNNFWGLWIYGEHATQRNGDAAIKISDAGGGFTDDLILQEGTKIRNDVAGDLIVQGNGAANDEDLKFDFETTANEVGVSSSTGVTEIDFGTINLATTGTIGTGNITMSSTAPTLTSKDTDATAGDANSSISTNCTDIGNGTEDCDVILTQQVAGANVDFMSADADGALYLNATGGIILQDDGGTSLAITNDATKTSLVPTAGDYLRIGDVASTTHALDTNDDLLVTGRLEIDGITFANAKVDLIDNIDLNLGTGEDVIFRFSTTQTPDTGLVGLGVEANSLVFVERADMSTDFAHALQTNPTLFIQSADALTPADYISITHDQTNGQIGSGTGALVLDASNGIVLNDSGTQALGVSSDGTLATILPAVGDYLRIGDANTTSQGFATNDDLVVTGGLEVNGATYIDGTQYVTTSGTVYYDQRPIYMGSSLDTTIVHSTVQTPDGLIWGVGAENNGLIISENADISYDFAHALQTNPTLWIQSATQSATQWMSLAHDQTDGRIITGAGNLSIGTGSDGHTLNTPNDLFVSGKVEADGAIFADAGITVNGGNIVLGNDWAWSGVTDVGNFFANLTSQTVDSMVFSVATGNRYIMMIEQGDQAVNFGHTAQTNPTLFIQSADATSVTDYMGLTHDQTNAVITAGNGAIIKDSVTATITASTTQTQGNGPLTTNINEVSVVANANDTVTLPAAAAGLCVKIANNGANVLQIFPASGDDLGAGVNTSDTLIATTNVEFCAYDNINWEIF